MPKLSDITNKLIGQPMFGVLVKAKELEKKRKRIFHYEIGDPNFNSPLDAINAVKVALDMGLTHYTSSFGLPELRNAVTDYVKKYNGFRPAFEQVFICPSNAVIDFVARCVVNAGEEIIYPDPGFPTYHSVINYNNFSSVPIRLEESNRFRLNPSDIKKAITDRTKLIIINSPSNPTGSVMTADEIREIYDIADKNDIFILADEVYSRIIYEGDFFSPSIYDSCKERTIILNGWSKLYSMSGWRLGFAVAPVELVAKMALLFQTIYSCFPPFIQFAGAKIIKGPQTVIERRVEELRKRRDILINGLNSIPYISCLLPEGSFYAFANISKTNISSEEYCDRLLEENGICLLPGSCFGQFGNDYVRLCYASVDEEEILESLELLDAFNKKLGEK